jgi:hypothetical protein
MVFMYEFSNFFNIVVLLVLGLPELSSSLTDARPTLKHECDSKTAVRLKKCSPKHEAFQVFQ